MSSRRAAAGAGGPLARWRLVLGQAAEEALGGDRLGAGELAADAALAWLYDRDQDLAARGIRPQRESGLGPSALTVPEWINEVHRLFPRETIERLERDAVERYRIDEIVTNPQVLERATPSAALLQAVLRTKHLMNPEVLELARRLVAEVVRELMEKLARKVEASFGGPRDRRRRTRLRLARNFDPRGTVRKNLAHYSLHERRLYIQEPRFVARSQRLGERWQIVLLVDQSGSMLGSVIHAAVTAACLSRLPSIRTHLCAFDTELVDLSDHADDAVEVLMKVQLGGGTDIARAVGWAVDVIEAPRRAIVVIVSDFFEGGDRALLLARVKALCEQGTLVLGLAALDEEARPAYDRDLARALCDAGAEVGAMTPGELAAWLASKVAKR